MILFGSKVTSLIALSTVATALSLSLVTQTLPPKVVAAWFVGWHEIKLRRRMFLGQNIPMSFTRSMCRKFSSTVRVGEINRVTKPDPANESRLVVLPVFVQTACSPEFDVLRYLV